MAISVKQAAKGNAPATGAPGPTPAPKAKPTPPDDISQVRSPTPAGYGQNGFAGRSSLNPGEQLLSPLAANLKASADDGENVLDTIVSRGVRQDDSITSQLRPITDKQAVPDAFGMETARSRQPTYPGPAQSIPATNDTTDAPPPTPSK